MISMPINTYIHTYSLSETYNLDSGIWVTRFIDDYLGDTSIADNRLTLFDILKVMLDIMNE